MATWFTSNGTLSSPGILQNYTYGSIEKGYYDPTAPDGDKYCIRCTIPPLMDDGHETGSLTITGMPSTYTEFWVKYWWKYSSNYVYHGVANKQMYFNPGNTMNMGIAGSKRRVNMMPQGSVTMSYLPNIVDPQTEAENFYAPVGVWYKYTGYYKLNTGTNANGLYKAWVNDILISDYSNIVYEYNKTTFSSLAFHIIWGGNNGSITPNYNMYVYIDDIYVGSTAPGSDPSVDTTPPYTDQFSPVENATGVPKSNRTISFHIKDA
jgi:hypothetical protein